MIKLMKYLKKSAGYVALIIALLFLQAYCDLSLPDYTSKIVNIGIQQKGIEDGVPEKIRKTSMDALELFMSQEDISELETAYTEDGELYVLKDIDKDTRSSLNEILGKPMLILEGLTVENETSGEMLAQMGIPEGADPVEVIAQMPEEARVQMTENMGEKFRDMPDSMITQAAVSYVQAEYELSLIHISEPTRPY